MTPADFFHRTLDKLRALVAPDAEAMALVDAAARVPAGLTRRAFLRAGLITAAVAATIDVDKLLWTPGERTILLPPEVVGVERVDIAWFAREALRAMEDKFQAFSRGPAIPAREPMDFGVDFDPRHGLWQQTPEQLRKQYIEPAARLLANTASHHGLTTFDEMPLPLDVEQAHRATSERTGLSVRVVSFYNAVHGQYIRLDVRGA